MTRQQLLLKSRQRMGDTQMVLVLETDKEPRSQGPVLAEGQRGGEGRCLYNVSRLLKKQCVG